MKLKLPKPPYPLRAGMQWDTDRDCVHVFDNGKPVMSICIAEITGELRKIERNRPPAEQAG